MEVIVQALTHQFNENRALNQLNLTITQGKITGIVGPDGAGKTTLLRLITGLLKPSSGQILINHKNPITHLAELRPFMGYMPQKFGLYEDLTVQENLSLYADLHSITKEARQERFKALLKFTDLNSFTSRLAGKLSGGMKQKLGLACVLINNPQLLLLDEPSVGVDPISRRELWKMVAELIQGGMTVLWSTAYLDEAERCDEVILINAGTVLYQGTPSVLDLRMQDRCFLITGSTDKRRVLQEALNKPETIDSIIQGKDIRLVIKSPNQLPTFSMSDLNIVPTAPRLEDSFIDFLGGAPKGESVLALHLHTQADQPTHLINQVIEAKNLTKKFGTFTATDAISFSVKQGEIFGLLGPNGAGKSTTFKMMCGLLMPTKGDAFVMGLDLKKSPGEARQQLGYMSQKFALYSQLSVQQNLYFFAGIYGLSGKARKQRIHEMIEIFSLSPCLSQNAGDLPLGFKQRLALACAMMHMPKILFLDEPTSGVDPLTRREFWTHINGLAEHGITIMVTTHFMDEAEYCDRIGFIYRGKLIACDTPDQLKESVASETLVNPSMEDTFIELIRRYDAG